MIQVWLHTFLHDDKVIAAFLLVALDFVFGVAAAVKMGTFRFSYLSDFLRNDILFKLLPYYVLYVAALVAGGVDIVIPGLDLGVIAGLAYATLVAAWVASILASLYQLKVVASNPPTLKTAVLAPENASPPKV